MKRAIIETCCLLGFCSFTVLAGDDTMDRTQAPGADAHTVLLLHFDDVTDGLAKDGSGRGNHGKIHGARPAEGKFGKGLKFDGEDDHVDCGGERAERPDLDFGDRTDFTVEFWFSTATTNRYSFLVNKKCSTAATEPGWTIFLHLGRVKALVSDSVKQVELSHEMTVDDGAWHHVALVVARKGEAVLYVDGKAGPSASVSGLIDVTNSRRTLRIGDRAHDGDFEGLIDEVRISNVARKLRP